MRMRAKVIVLAAVFGCAPILGAAAQERINRDEFPYSIMRAEAGSQPSRASSTRKSSKSRTAKPAAAQPQPAAREPSREVKRVPPRRARGSSTFSTIPTHQSPLTPLGVAPTIGTVQPMGRAPSIAAPVPGVYDRSGNFAVTPPRPANQGFQDRATTCIQSGGVAGVSPGQMGAYTRSCVNR